MEFRKYNYPAINMHIPSKIHPDYEKIYEDASKWTVKFQLHSSDNDQLKRENVVKMTCMCYPDGDYERTLLIVKFIVHLFALDDTLEGNVKCLFFDSLVMHGSENKDVIELMDNCFEIKGIPLVTSFADVWKQMKAISNKTWQKRFAENYIWYLKANSWEHKNVETKRTPPLAEYLEYRHYVGGVDSALNLIEISRNIFIPDSVAANVTFQRLSYLSGNFVALVNDIYSYEKEKFAGQINNIVNVMKHEYNISDQEAIEKATDYVVGEMKRFSFLEPLLPTFYGEMNEMIQKYIDGCKMWMSGSYNWGLKSSRYIVKEG